MNPFEILNIEASPAVTDEMVRDAWRRGIFDCHPDRNPNDPQAAAKFARVQEAYDRLRSADRRAAAAAEFGVAYEIKSRSGVHTSFDRFFSNLDAEAAARKRSPFRVGPRDGLNIHREMAISLAQAFRGGSFRIDHKAAVCGGCHGAGRIHKRFPSKCPSCDGHGSTRAADGLMSMQVECPTCIGRGKVSWVICGSCGGAGQVDGVSATVEVPAGVDTGFEIKLPGLGTAGAEGGRAGDLTVTLRVMDDRTYQRRGADLLLIKRVPVWDAALGSRLKVKGIDGRTLEFDIPAGCRNGQIHSLRAEGMTTLEGPRGKLLVKIEIVVPDANDGRMRNLFEEMRKLASATDSPANGA